MLRRLFVSKTVQSPSLSLCLTPLCFIVHCVKTSRYSRLYGFPPLLRHGNFFLGSNRKTRATFHIVDYEARLPVTYYHNFDPGYTMAAIIPMLMHKSLDINIFLSDDP